MIDGVISKLIGPQSLEAGFIGAPKVANVAALVEQWEHAKARMLAAGYTMERPPGYWDGFSVRGVDGRSYTYEEIPANTSRIQWNDYVSAVLSWRRPRPQ